jgi:hypothetical protein
MNPSGFITTEKEFDILHFVVSKINTQLLNSQ